MIKYCIWISYYTTFLFWINMEAWVCNCTCWIVFIFIFVKGFLSFISSDNMWQLLIIDVSKESYMVMSSICSIMLALDFLKPFTFKIPEINIYLLILVWDGMELTGV